MECHKQKASCSVRVYWQYVYFLRLAIIQLQSVSDCQTGPISGSLTAEILTIKHSCRTVPNADILETFAHLLPTKRSCGLRQACQAESSPPIARPDHLLRLPNRATEPSTKHSLGLTFHAHSLVLVKGKAAPFVDFTISAHVIEGNVLSDPYHVKAFDLPETSCRDHGQLV